MARLLRPTGAAVVAALLMAGAATASTLQVTAAKGAFRIDTKQTPGVYRTTVVVPTVYTLRARAVHGTAVIATVNSKLHGSVRAVDPAPYDNDQCAANVGYDHAAVWLVRAAGASMPVYVDAGPQGTTLLTWCASPATHLPVLGVSLSLRGAFALPAMRSRIVWNAQFDSGTTERVRAVAR
jgi:hypothetical protein